MASADGTWMVGIDIGGTFTDVAALHTDTRELVITKVPSVPADPSIAVIKGLEQLRAADPRIQPGAITFFGHGTTVATNALLELKGARAGMLVTEGMRALYELRGGTKPSGSDLLDTFYQKPQALIPQRFTRDIPGRIAYDGSVLQPLDEAAVRTAVRELRDQGVEAIAVCFLFSFMNPAHERRTREIIEEEYPGCRVSLSSIVLPVIREYRRISTTVLDAYVGPVVSSYLERLTGRLRDAELETEQLYIMQSNGGLMRIDLAARYPNQTLLSGPAAGVVFGAALGQALEERYIVTFDMGGTSTDIAVIPEGSYHETREGTISGQDIGTPMIEIRTLGAGGGTIAWIGPDGLLKAGPQSAGASPGPASYGRGGTQPTVTDANLLLGYLSPAGLAGGRMTLQPELAEEAVRTYVAEPLGLEVEEAALGIVRVVNVTMEVGLRLSLVEQGLDQRQFALVAFGGGGPVHAARVARNVGIPRVIVPPRPGIGCAIGLLQTDVKHFYLKSHLAPLHSFPADELQAQFRDLEERARADALVEGLPLDELQLQRQLDLRYPYQGYELTVTCPSGAMDERAKADLRREFDRLHEQVYGTSAPDEQPEVVNVRVVSTASLPKVEMAEETSGEQSPAQARKGQRRAVFEEVPWGMEVSVYDRARLRAANRIEGPAIVEQLDSTTVICPGQVAEVDRIGNLVIDTGVQGPTRTANGRVK